MSRQDANARPWEWPLLRLIVIGLVLETTLAALALLHDHWAWLVLVTSAALVAGWTWWTRRIERQRGQR